MFLFTRRYKCIVCNKYHHISNVHNKYKGICVCKNCLSEMETGGDKSFESKAPVDYVLAPFYYEGKLKQTVKQFKFSEQKAYGILLGELLSEELSMHKELSQFDYIIPVPLHGTRIDERGYNQAEILSQELSNKLNGKCMTDSVFRIKETKRQSQLRGTDRIENVKSAFYAAENVISGKNIILVDDIYTMGETMSACAKALKAAGANKIIGVALCRTKPKDRPIFYR